MKSAIHLNLDDAWKVETLPWQSVDARAWGPRLRFSAPSREIERFYEEVRSQLAPFVVYGSGDFHHLTALWLRRLNRLTTVVSFDNHPDWDIRPPKWGCGGWVNRALELAQVETVTVWGCGNFELDWPGHLYTVLGVNGASCTVGVKWLVRLTSHHGYLVAGPAGWKCIPGRTIAASRSAPGAAQLCGWIGGRNSSVLPRSSTERKCT